MPQRSRSRLPYLLELAASVLFVVSITAVTARPSPAFHLPLGGSPGTRQSGSKCQLNDLNGYSTLGGACRYTLQYATVAERWGYSTITTSLSANIASVSLPPACPQSGETYHSGQTSEDCLYATLYAPSYTRADSGLPVFVWVHGGSFVEGSASAPGLDASALAKEGILVIIMQYRLGVLGFLPPALASSTSDPNLGLLDLINGLKAIKDNIRTFGGDPSQVTVGGQSAGAGMIRSMLGAHAAKGLFRSAILQSDPLSYGLASTVTTNQLRDGFYSSDVFSKCTDLACYRAISTSQILEAQDNLLSYAPYTFESVPLAEVIWPTHGTTTIPLDPTPLLFNNPHALPISPSDISLMITTVQNEGGSGVQKLFPVSVPISNTTFQTAMSGLIGQDRATALSSSTSYALNARDGDTMRETFERVVTDGVWRCPNRAVAQSWANLGGRVWVGEWTKGITYPTNEGSYCKKDGRVCHEDDIVPTFGSSSGDLDLQGSINTLWVSFIKTSVPTSSKDQGWTIFRRIRDYLREKAHGWLEKAKASRPHWLQSRQAQTSWEKYDGTYRTIFPIGGGEVTSCPDVGWGERAKYDWQLYP